MNTQRQRSTVSASEPAPKPLAAGLGVGSASRSSTTGRGEIGLHNKANNRFVQHNASGLIVPSGTSAADGAPPSTADWGTPPGVVRLD